MARCFVVAFSHFDRSGLAVQMTAGARSNVVVDVAVWCMLEKRKEKTMKKMVKEKENTR